MKLSDLVSPALRPLLPQELWDLDASEPESSCSSCPQVNLGQYKSDLKCCTYQPFLPNYVVGGLLTEALANASLKAPTDWISEVVRQRQCAVPLGLRGTFQYQKLSHQPGPGAFGNSKELRCSFFNLKEQTCGIWPWRGSVCLSFFCKPTRRGESFWALLKEYLMSFEMTVAQDIAVISGYGPRSLNLQIHGLDSRTEFTEGDWQELWGDYYLKELNYYRFSFEKFKEYSLENLFALQTPEELRLRQRIIQTL